MTVETDSAGYIHPDASIAPSATIGEGTFIWAGARIREGAAIGRNCMVACDAMVGKGVRVGDGSRIQEGARLYAGVTLGRNVFVGPETVFCNERKPRVRLPDDEAFVPEKTEVGDGANIGANVTVIPPRTIGARSTIGGGSVVTRDVPPGVTVCGNPARPLAEEGAHS